MMKVVLFCGGAGMRLRGYDDDVPKPMVKIGTRPILWHSNEILCPLWT
jgi:glucose-1-phosphate cytidylyltransferase